MSEHRLSILEQQIAQLAEEIAQIKRNQGMQFSQSTTDEYLLGVYNCESCTNK
ncbi:hypothetical protein NSQ26_09460 [Bacillus sp. FSL W7-1360]